MINLREKRVEKNMTQDELANECGVTRTTISMIENGNNMPSIELAKKIGNILSFDWSDFFNDNITNS